MLTELQKAQIKFAQDTAKLIQFAATKKIHCFPHELGLLQNRKVLLANGSVAKGRDIVHMMKGNHYRFLAFDLIVFDPDGVRISDGMNRVWKELGEYWESLDPENDNGREWGDANHFSRKWMGFK